MLASFSWDVYFNSHLNAGYPFLNAFYEWRYGVHGYSYSYPPFSPFVLDLRAVTINMYIHRTRVSI